MRTLIAALLITGVFATTGYTAEPCSAEQAQAVLDLDHRLDYVAHGTRDLFNMKMNQLRNANKDLTGTGLNYAEMEFSNAADDGRYRTLRIFKAIYLPALDYERITYGKFTPDCAMIEKVGERLQKTIDAIDAFRQGNLLPVNSKISISDAKEILSGYKKLFETAKEETVLLEGQIQRAGDACWRCELTIAVPLEPLGKIDYPKSVASETEQVAKDVLNAILPKVNKRLRDRYRSEPSDYFCELIPRGDAKIRAETDLDKGCWK